MIRSERDGNTKNADSLRAKIKDRMQQGDLPATFRFRGERNEQQPGRQAPQRPERSELVSSIADRASLERRTVDLAAVRQARVHVRGWNPDSLHHGTRERYRDMVQRLDRTAQLPEQAAGTTRAYHIYRAALVHEARAELKEALGERDKASRTRDEAAKAQAETRIATALVILDRYPPGERDHESNLTRVSLYQGPRQSERSNGKRDVLAERPADWRDRVWAQSRPQDQGAVAVLALTGARPAELEKGVHIERTSCGLAFTIRGAKVDDSKGRGQPERTITVPRVEAEKSVEGRHLLEIARSGKDVRIESANAFTQRIAAAGERAGLERVSAYDYRHAFSSRMKAEGIERAQIAAALGHQAERSQAKYGSAGLASRSGSGSALSASASRSTRA